MKNSLIKNPFRLLISAVLLALIVSAAIPSSVLASSVTVSVRYTASYVSGTSGSKNVYYVLDDGSAQSLGSVSSSNAIDITFNATFSSKIRVYVDISDNAIYNQHLYINGNQESSGNVGGGGLTYARNDTTSPSGKITFPLANATITNCPVMITANVTDDLTGIKWVIYNVKYDGAWYQIGTDDSKSSAKGWGASWDCSNVADQSISVSITAMDNAGNRGSQLGGVVIFNLAKGPTPLQLSSTINPTDTPIPPTLTPEQPTAMIPPTVTIQPAGTDQTNQASPDNSTPTLISTTQATAVPSKTAPQLVITCPTAFVPLLVGMGLMARKKRSKIGI